MFNGEDELSDLDLKSLEDRGKILVSTAHHAFDVPISSIESINSKIVPLIQIITALGALGVVIIIFLYERNYQYSLPSLLFGWTSAILWLFSFILLSYSIRLKTYKTIKFFEDERFNQLCNKEAYDLLSDSLFQMKKSYEFNKERCKELVRLFDYAYILFFIMVFSSILFVLSIISDFLQ